MLTINIDPVLIHLGPFAISWYGLAVTLAIVVGWGLWGQVRQRAIGTPKLSS